MRQVGPTFGLDYKRLLKIDSMKNSVKITALAAFALIGKTSFGQSLNFNGGLLRLR